MRNPLLFLCLLSASCFSQTITAVQQKALNNYVDYANHSADEVAKVVKGIISYYPTIHQKGAGWAPRYTCPIQQEDYYLNFTMNHSDGLPAPQQTTLNAKLKDLQETAEKIDAHCKALDTYHKLEDYKQDNFARAETLIDELQELIVDYKWKQNALQLALDAAYKKLTIGAPENDYRKANGIMHAEIAMERNFLDLFSFNLNENVHTGWLVDTLKQNILDSDSRLTATRQLNVILKYPASSMWTSFQESVNAILTLKRSGLDGYNFEAKKSDKHSNEVYLGLINYFNGTLIADQNTFTTFAEQQGYYALKAINYLPVFEIKTKQEVVEVVADPFRDIPRNPIAVSIQKRAITTPVYETLSNYVDYINETWRQTRYLQMVLSSFGSTASYYRNLETFGQKGALSFEYKDFRIPLSQYQKTVADSRLLPPAVANSLNDQCEVLLNILKEMDQLGASLEIETREKRYERDHLSRVYAILERQKVLFNLWDERKELLYLDVRKIYGAYPPAQLDNSWFVAGEALLKLTDLDHDGLFAAKAYYQGDEGLTISTDKIDSALRDVIAKEYDNMRGIRKLGRSNGLCPYTPYEDIPLTSKSLSEAFKKLKPAINTSNYDHPYHTMVYHYNDIVDDYNKFCELSKDILRLKAIKQPELYTIKDPAIKSVKVTGPQASVIAQKAQPSDLRNKSQQENVNKNTQAGRIQHDTVFIARRDTVYLSEPGENLHAMAGYATNNMILLLDVSGSMNTPEKLPLLKKSVMRLLSMMRQEDAVSIISFSQKPKAILTAVSFREEAMIERAIENLKPSGKTDGNAAVRLAYKVADENYIRGGNNRIILATDGEFAVREDTRQLIERFSKEDIFLSVFNFGNGAGASKVLENLADLGKGNYAHISKENVDLKLIGEAKAKKQK